MATDKGKKPSFMKGGIGNVSSYLGRRPPAEVKAMLESLHELHQQDKTIFKKVLQFVVEHLKGTEITEEQWKKLIEQTPVEAALLRLLFAGLLMMIRTAVRIKVNEEDFKIDLQNLQVTGDFVPDLVAALKKSRSIVEKITVEEGENVSFPTLDSMDWRVDVSISTSEMARLLKPTILMRMVDSDGNIKTFEMNLEQFNKLRYNVARVIKEFDIIEKLPILKIDKQA
eukprot:TRINITY_DN6157_c0_g1_i2.p1 TRINITY_DN6157_c0_g1~~TRINITY_DN6157_c0_g1_i2.p1  ORF type:complete len:227 (-),score=47.13 TRINITY_DN6157_c0_g1_i2:29-709(-)